MHVAAAVFVRTYMHRKLQWSFYLITYLGHLFTYLFGYKENTQVKPTKVYCNQIPQHLHLNVSPFT